jgi:crossover junction endodeoxyribonuclease RusA
MTDALQIPWPPSTNSLWRARAGRNILSQRYREWRKTAGLEIMAQRPKKHSGPVSIAIELSAPDRRSFDIDNRSKALLDLLVMCRVIEADSSDVVRELHIRLGEGFTGARVSVRPAPRHHYSY